MKKLEGVVWCCTCRPFQRFNPPNAAEKAQQHYDAGKHVITERVGGSAVSVD